MPYELGGRDMLSISPEAYGRYTCFFAIFGMPHLPFVDKIVCAFSSMNSKQGKKP